MMGRLAALALLCAISVCAANEKSDPGSSALSSVVARVPLTSGPPGATALMVSIGLVQNPDQAPIDLHVAIVDETTSSTPVGVGSVSLYPSDQPAQFVLRLPRPLSDTFRNRAPSTSHVVLSLVRPPDASISSRVVLGEIAARLVGEPE